MHIQSTAAIDAASAANVVGGVGLLMWIHCQSNQISGKL